MAELLIRPGSQDVTLIETVLGGEPTRRPSRVVVDAHVAVRAPRIAAAAARAGVPFLVDPQTHLLQDYQHPADHWAQLPFARPELSTPADLLRPGRAEQVAAGVIEYQLQHGASAVIAPYVHIARRDDGWREVQTELWRATRRYADQANVRVPILAVVALGWRLLDRCRWQDAFNPLRAEMSSLNPCEVLLAASRVDAGATPDHRLASMIAVIRRLSRTHPVITWQQGALGLAAVAGGAMGYECGIGWRDRCDLAAAMAQHRTHNLGGTARPVYITSLLRSIPKASVRALHADPRILAALTCLDPSCCPNGRLGLLEDMRPHAIASRLAALRDLIAPAQPAWRWNHLARAAQTGLDLAQRINTLGVSGVARIDLTALQATLTVADNRRQTLRRGVAA